MIQIIEDFIASHELVVKGDHILAAVSGGPDSIALIHYLNDRYMGNCHLSVAHVEHGLRGKESIEDMEFVEEFCKKWSIPFYSHQPNIGKLKKEKGISTQEAARMARYSWFQTLMPTISANKLALAHHGDDQIETILMRQVRGSLAGLAGIPVKRLLGNLSIIRPFLCVEKKDILTYCKEKGLSFRIDQTNETNTYQRNRFRKKILPFLKEENPKVHEAFQRQSEWIKEDNDFLQSLAETEIKTAVSSQKLDEISINIQSFLQIPIALQRRGVHLLLNYLSEDIGNLVTAKHLDSVVSLLKKDSPSGILHLPKGVRVEKSYNDCVLSLRNPSVHVPLEIIEIPIPGMVPLKKGKITSSIVKEAVYRKEKNAVFTADLNKLSIPLFIRSRQEGDRISPLGLNGSKKLKNLFMEEKIPKADREQWPVIMDKNGKVIWVPLLKRSNIALLTENTEDVLMLVYDRGDV